MKAPSRHPYFPYPAMQLLKEQGRALDGARLDALKLSVALNAADPRAVALYVDLDGDDWLHIYPAAEAPAPMSTVDAIDTFLETYGRSTPQEEALLERMIFNPVPEYSQVLAAQAASEGEAPVSEKAPAAPAEKPAPAAEKAAQPQSQEEIIDNFLATHPDETAPAPAPAAQPEAACSRHGQTRAPEPAAPVAPAPAPAPAHAAAVEQPTLSESLAQIFIRQGRYERAFEIISALNLKNPEKSVYFADQLRFLQKVIALQQRRKAARES